ncbi:MAG TPA: type II secretion system protein N [Burkholderiaceae bacterium]
MRLMLWLIAGIISAAITLLAFCPASWISTVVENKSGGRLALGDPQGTVWNGSAFIGGAPGSKSSVTPLLPGRFTWHLSPAVLLGQVDAEIANPEALSQAITIKGDWTQWQVSPAAIKLPADRLVGLGAPLNTMQPTGQIQLSWNPLQVVRDGQKVGLSGLMTLDMQDMASRLSPIKPLGTYQLLFDWHGQQAQLTLKTVKGPMLLSGSGNLNNGRLQFSGKADAEAGQETRLANLLNLLGQRRREGGRDVIALEFRQ